jgi:hypothetical protein
MRYADAGPAIAASYRERTGWEPGSEGGDWVYFLLKPARIQVWRDVDEIAGRSVMADGTWLARGGSLARSAGEG